MIDVLLSTYNGEKYLPVQLNSLLSQDFTDWRVIARDDGSNDRSLDILRDYAKKYPARFEIIEDGLRLGAMQSFSALMRRAGSAYIAFCDQDDFWLPQKLSTLYALMQAEEKCWGTETPILVHSDLELVDADLQPISPSFWAFQGIEPSRNSLANLLVENTVTGCSVLINKRLNDLGSSVPGDAYMHDYWLALVAATLGKICFTRETLIKYRQHNSNTLGAVRLRRLISFPGGSFNPKKWKISYHVASSQAKALVKAFDGAASSDVLVPALRLSKLYEHGWLGRRLVLLMNDILPSRLRRKISVLARI